MRDVYLYADETGNLDYGAADAGGKTGATTYFGFGTAVYYDDHGSALMGGLRLRTQVTAQGIDLRRGFHAKDDSHRTRAQVFDVIREQSPRFDTTFLCKQNAHASVRAKGEMHLYGLAWYLHLKQIAQQVARADDHLYVIAGSFGTHRRLSEAKAALADVCGQVDRRITLCVWDASSSWGLQVADYALWAVQRRLEGRQCAWFDTHVEPHLRSHFVPWGTAQE